MKKFSVNKLLTILTLVLLVSAFLISAAFAESAAEGDAAFTEWKERLLTLPKFTFQHHKEGIAYGSCPVYTAPSDNALRLANNRAECDTNKDLYEAGFSEEGWLLVRYEPGNGTVRVGYIPPKYVKGFKSGMSVRNFSRIPAVAADTIYVMDNPVKNYSSIAELASGDSFVILAKYTYHGNWWYIECTADGKTARGFIDREKSSFCSGGEAGQTPVTLGTLGIPGKSPLGTEKTGEILVNGSTGDERKRVYKDADPDSKWVTVVYPARRYPCYGNKDAKGSSWYYIFVEEDSAWGWVRSSYCTFED